MSLNKDYTVFTPKSVHISLKIDNLCILITVSPFLTILAPADIAFKICTKSNKVNSSEQF